MNREQILAMEAGRELDALIAKGIMDIIVGYPQGGGYPFYLQEDNKGEMKWKSVAFYSTDISAAWQVVEKMQGEDLAGSFTLYWGNGWWCFFMYKDLAGNPIYAIKADTAPEAICKSALIAKLEER